ncbi:amidohydrolase family protein [Methylosinus sp. Ce-a6]|uniref:amidohydrolase family protein n=1 Tax=Methylosinus sp. Ce-a6 TaxID=2172005 RepID=UPI001357E125|nr:amidohydrolase family protein [Methylosinus sp. Ce-a6]
MNMLDFMLALANYAFHFLRVLGAFGVAAGCGFGGQAMATQADSERLLIRAARLFDGKELRIDRAVLVAGSEIVAIGSPAELRGRAVREMDLGDATLMPGFIELHAHLAFRKVPREIVLRHGVTTVRDVGGPLLPPSGGRGALRLLTAGPIITVQNGYPISVFGKGYIAETAQSPEEARQLVGKLVEGGAVVIKIALEPGGEPGAPWSMGHHGGAHPPWPLSSLDVVSAIVAEAHRLGRRVTAHLGESQGAALALAAGIDEWAHVPCSEISDELIEQAVRQKVKIVTTFDTMSHCSGIHTNAARLAKLGAVFLYGAEIAHPDIPWGIDAQELQLMRHFTGMSTLEVLRSATSKAGDELGMTPLGTLSPGAPADIIAVRGNPFEDLKILEYPALVISGGQIVVNEFDK